MLNNVFKNKINNGELTFGSWCQVGHPANVEILANAGFEWLVADCEHGEFEDSDLGNFCRAVCLAGKVPLVRVKENAIMPIRRALDLGAVGIIVPLVNSAEEVAKAVAAAKYPPEGVRGFAFHRGNNWGVDFAEYVKNANKAIAVIVMIESKEAVENIDEILQTDGVDGVFIGPYDMSGSYGIIGQTDNPLIKEACSKVAIACKKYHKTAGAHIVMPNSENVDSAVKQGFHLLALGMDTVFLANGAKQALEMMQND
ncbi:MAG: aldolase/citrate lyase family protein [Victivallaceae bacterium]|nr:aldolase/citrate lyase family protein [Victivallaceae bacterium]